MSTEVSSTRLYLGNVPRNATKADVEKHFEAHGTGHIKEIKLMNGFGFVEYDDPQDAMDVVPAYHGSEFMGERLTVQFARGARQRDPLAGPERIVPRPRRTPYRMQITGLLSETSWQDLKDFARQSTVDVVYSETGRERDGRGFVEFETATDLKTAVEKLDGREFKGERVTCVADVQDERPRERYRSRSPHGRGSYVAPEEYGRRGGRGGGGYSPPRHGYRNRTPPPPPPPPPRDYYESRDRYRSPPRRPPMDDYLSARRGGYPDDPYDRPPPRRTYEPDPYMNGHARPYDRPPSPRGRPRSPRGYHEYDRRGGYY